LFCEVAEPSVLVLVNVILPPLLKKYLALSAVEKLTVSSVVADTDQLVPKVLVALVDKIDWPLPILNLFAVALVATNSKLKLGGPAPYLIAAGAGYTSARLGATPS
jgi:hypothetical protein